MREADAEYLLLRCSRAIHIADITQSVRDVLKAHQDAVQAKLDERAALREEKALLDLLQRLFEILSRAESLQDSNSSKMVARLAGEYTQLVYLRDKAAAEGCKIVDAVSSRIDAIRVRLSGDLSSILTAALESKDEAALKQCLKTYDLVEGWSEAEDVVRQNVRSFCAQNITAASLTHTPSPIVPTTPGRTFERPSRLTEESNISALYNRILAHVETYLPLLSIAHSVSKDFDFFSRVIWPEIGVTITENLGHVVFAAGRPDDLHRHYTTTHNFLSLLENCAPTPDAVLAMRASDSYAAFERRWQLPVYFQLRWKEIVSTFEAALAGTTPASAIPGFALAQSGAAWEAFRQCWSPEIYLPELSHRFWRLGLQIVSRYSSWLTSTLATFKGEEDDDAALRFAASAVMDMDALRERIAGLSVLTDLGGFPLSLDYKPFSARIVSILQRRCSEPVKAVRSVASQLRASPPKTTAPSHFIPSLLKPLHAFFDARPSLAKEHKEAWSAEVVGYVCGQYTSILASVRKTEDLLRRHRKSKKGGFSLFGANTGSADTADEDERFRAQMITDVDALAKDALSLGVQVEDMGTWTELKEVVERPAE